jgi:hypothetical protein
VGTSEVADNTLAATDLAADSVGASELADNSVDAGAILADAVTSGKISNGTIASADLSSTGGSEAVATANIQADAVTSAKIANGTIASADLSSTGGSEAVATANIQANAVTSAKIANDAVNTAQVADASTTAGVGLKQADVGLDGSFTVTPGSNIASARCTDFTPTATGVAAGDAVILNGPTGASTTGYAAQVVTTAANQVTVRICNHTGSNAGSGVNFGFTYLAIH